MRVAPISLLLFVPLFHLSVSSEAQGQGRKHEDLDEVESSSSYDGGGRRRGRFAGALGLGAILGSPSGLSGKVMFFDRNAFQLHLGFGFGEKGRLVIIGDYLFHFLGVLPSLGNAGGLVPYVGVGGRIGIRDEDPVVGVRVPLGISLLIFQAPVEIFLEVALGIGLVPETAAIVDGGIGGRWYF